MKQSDLSWNEEKTLANKSLCHELPPKDIYDVLHMAECAGVEIPHSVDQWWEKETEKEQG